MASFDRKLAAAERSFINAVLAPACNSVLWGNVSWPPYHESYLITFFSNIWYYIRVIAAIVPRAIWPVIIPIALWAYCRHTIPATDLAGLTRLWFWYHVSMVLLLFGVPLWAFFVLAYNVDKGEFNIPRPKPRAVTYARPVVARPSPLNRVGSARPLGEARFAQPDDINAALGGRSASSPPAPLFED